jgi:hypothetical protein
MILYLVHHVSDYAFYLCKPSKLAARGTAEGTFQIAILRGEDRTRPNSHNSKSPNLTVAGHYSSRSTHIIW